MDLTLIKYNILLKALQHQGFSFLTFEEYVLKSVYKVIVLRHDIDRLPGNSLEFARIQANMGIKGTYYFRAVPESWDEEIMKKISDLGCEIGYHYEDLSFAWAKLKAEGRRQKTEGKELRAKSKKYEIGSKEYEKFEKQLVDIAIESFKENLERLRKIVPVKTISMHGSPISMWDSRLLWKYYDYHDFGIIGEPYFDIDFDEVMYLTDTGRCWDGESVSMRDKAVGRRRKAEGEDPYKDWKVKPIPGSLMNMTEKSMEFQSRYNFRSTKDIIKAAERNELPDRIMMTFHPQRWTDEPLPWARELIWQNVKNMGKYFVVKVRSEK